MASKAGQAWRMKDIEIMAENINKMAVSGRANHSGMVTGDRKNQAACMAWRKRRYAGRE
jgi:collagenase-like PrtC family protease